MLLSDPFSNFICLTAVDSRITCRAIESTMKPQTCTSGHRFLKKIINLPFCLPNVGKQFEIEFFGSVSGFSTYAYGSNDPKNSNGLWLRLGLSQDSVREWSKLGDFTSGTLTKTV